MSVHLKLEGNRLTIVWELDTCKNCGKPMVPWWKHPEGLVPNLELDHLGIVFEEYNSTDLCQVCIKQGGYSRQCDICYREVTFPDGFAFNATTYRRDDDPKECYICRECVETRPAKVIDALVAADDIEDLRKTDDPSILARAF